MDLTFDTLAEQIKAIHISAKTHAIGAVNRTMTLRNWLIGCYIVEFEQHGQERSQYGEYLVKRLEEKINEKGLNKTLFKASRKFYLTYPQIGSIVSNQLEELSIPEIGSTLSNLLTEVKQNNSIDSRFVTPPETLVSRLSFSHIREIMPISDPFERFFYEYECMRCGWSVKELRRQIATTLYFRAGISQNTVFHPQYKKHGL